MIGTAYALEKTPRAIRSQYVKLDGPSYNCKLKDI